MKKSKEIRVASITSDTVPLVSIEVEGKVCDAFIDTGASPNLVSRSQVENMNLLKQIKKPSKSIQELILTSASGNRLNISGSISMELDFGEFTTKLTFIVVDHLNIPGELLIGYSSLKQIRAILIPGEALIIKNTRIPLTHKSRKWDKKVRMNTVSDSTEGKQVYSG